MITIGRLGAAAGVAWSADGSKIAVSLEAGPVAVGEFDGKKFEPRAAFLGHAGAASGVVFTADGKGVFTTGADKTLRTWDIAKNGSTAIESDLPAFGEAVAATADGASTNLPSRRCGCSAKCPTCRPVSNQARRRAHASSTWWPGTSHWPPGGSACCIHP